VGCFLTERIDTRRAAGRYCSSILIIEALLLSKLAAREHEVYSREIVKVALRHNASSVIFAHNHPSGNVEPSAKDVATTRRLREALAYVDIRVIDHLIVGKTIMSFAKRGLLVL
jgi:DNA repair protein RadC